MTELIAKDLPEVLSILDTLKINITDSTAHINHFHGKIANDEVSGEDGLSFLEMKCQLFLNYLINLTYLMLLKVDGKPFVEQACIERLVEIRTVLEKIRPIEKKLTYQIDKLVKLAATESLNDQQDPLSFKPNLDNLVGKDEEESDSEGEGENNEKSGVYVPPKVSAVHYDEDIITKKEKMMEKARQRSLNSALLQDLRTEYSEAPEEIRNERNSTKRARMRQKEDERERFEEDNLRRLTVTKKDKMASRKLNAIDEIVKVGSFRRLESDDSDDGDNYKPKAKKKKKSRQIKSKFSKKMQKRRR